MRLFISLLYYNNRSDPLIHMLYSVNSRAVWRPPQLPSQTYCFPCSLSGTCSTYCSKCTEVALLIFHDSTARKVFSPFFRILFCFVDVIAAAVAVVFVLVVVVAVVTVSESAVFFFNLNLSLYEKKKKKKCVCIILQGLPSYL
jgi:hypothetical protein